MAVTSMNATNEHLMNSFISKYDHESFKSSDCFMRQIFTIDGKHLAVNAESILSKYQRELSQYIEKMDLSTTDYIKYRFNPKRFSYDIYGTTELWFLVLYANELYNIGQFDLHSVYYYSPASFIVLNRILDLEQIFVDINESECDEILRTPIE